MKKLFYTVFFAFNIIVIFSQGEAKSGFGISFSGFVKTDIIYDSRQTAGIREGHFLLYPLPELLDKNKDDINAKGNFQMLSLQSRLAGKITGPDAFGAKTSGLLEAEFFGTADGDMNGFRLRHAYVNMDWGQISLLVGQTWNPFFVTDVSPGTVSFNTGAPIQPFARNPQIKVVYTSGDLKFIGVAYTQRDFQSLGPGGSSTSYIRNSGFPALHAQFQYNKDGNVFGAGVDLKSLLPKLSTAQNYKTDETISSFALIGYGKITGEKLTVKAEAVYGGNMTDLLMIGGYAVKSTNLSGFEEYTAIKTMSVWGEISTGKEVELGLFAGYSKNMGADDPITGAIYSRGADIDNILRISPRVQWNSGKTRIGLEFDYTSAGYGITDKADKGKVKNVSNVSNLRFLTAFYYFF